MRDERAEQMRNDQADERNRAGHGDGAADG
jgi:hypothetical protein